FLHRGSRDGARTRVVVKVCDFGIAKRTSEIDASSADLTRTGGMLGSPVYMSPEQAKSAKTVDARSDIWSLCISMHEALCGRRPWEELTPLGEAIVAICTRPVPPLAALAPWVPPELASIVARGLAADPSARWPSMDALIDALEPLAGTEALTLEE